jgi:RND family efflux transporter MFP subunit
MSRLNPSRRALGRFSVPGAIALCTLLWVLPVAGWTAPPRVTVVALHEVLETPVYSAPATVVARDAPQIAAEVAARIVELPVIVGDRVASGTPLARLDCRRLEAQRDAARAALNQAEADLRFARRQLNRAEDLRKKKSISEELLDQRQTELASRETQALSSAATFRQTEIDVDACELRSPLAAVVTARHASVGDYVTPGTPVIALTAAADQEVSIALRTDQIASFRDAMEWTFEHDGTALPLELRTIVPVIDTTSRTREARLGFAQARAIPGTPGRVSWRSQSRQIPSDYLVRRDDRLGVFVLNDQAAQFVALPEAQEGRPAATSLPPQTRLIAEGRQRLRDGDRVEVVSDTEESG